MQRISYTVNDHGTIIASGVSEADALLVWAGRRNVYKPEFQDGVTVAVVAEFIPTERQLYMAVHDDLVATGPDANMDHFDALVAEHRKARDLIQVGVGS